MLQVLIASLAKPFYRQHAGYFLVGCYVLFGMAEPSALASIHEALLLSSISSPPALFIVFACWFVYGIKAYAFVKIQLASPCYKFVTELGALPRNLQIQLWSALYAVVVLPIIIYSILMCAIGLKNLLFVSVFCVLVVVFTLILSLSWLTYQIVSQTSMRRSGKQRKFNIKVRKPFFSWPLYYLIDQQTLLLMMCKASSLVCFRVVMWMFADVGSSVRVSLIALLTSVLCHSVLVSTLLKFEIMNLNFSRSLPIPVYSRLLKWLGIFSIVMIPEWILIFTSSGYDWILVLNGLLFGLAGLLFLLSILYMVKLDSDCYFKTILLFFFIAMWAILGNYHLLFSLLLLSFSTFFYLIKFNRIDLTIER